MVITYMFNGDSIANRRVDVPGLSVLNPGSGYFPFVGRFTTMA